jgi:subtilisin-like proprotein convertase family protein
MSLFSPRRAALLLPFILIDASALLFAPAAIAGTEVVFTNAGAITINDDANASPYPSNIVVSRVNPALVTKVQVRLNGLSHNFPDDVDVILVGPQGQRAVLMSDAGGNPDLSNVILTFDQTATVALPDDDQTNSGTYRPDSFAPI